MQKLGVGAGGKMWVWGVGNPGMPAANVGHSHDIQM